MYENCSLMQQTTGNFEMTHRDLSTPFSTLPLLLLLLLLFLLHALFHTLFLFLFSCPRTADTVAFLECTSEDHAWCKAILVEKILYLIHQFPAMMLRRFTIRKGIFKWIQHFGVKGVSSGCSWRSFSTYSAFLHIASGEAVGKGWDKLLPILPAYAISFMQCAGMLLNLAIFKFPKDFVK